MSDIDTVVNEYVAIEETFSPAVLDTITEWITTRFGRAVRKD